MNFSLAMPVPLPLTQGRHHFFRGTSHHQRCIVRNRSGYGSFHLFCFIEIANSNSAIACAQIPRMQCSCYELRTKLAVSITELDLVLPNRLGYPALDFWFVATPLHNICPACLSANLSVRHFYCDSALIRKVPCSGFSRVPIVIRAPPLALSLSVGLAKISTSSPNAAAQCTVGLFFTHRVVRHRGKPVQSRSGWKIFTILVRQALE